MKKYLFIAILLSLMKRSFVFSDVIVDKIKSLINAEDDVYYI